MLNVALAVLCTVGSVGIVALLPGVGLAVRILAAIGVVAIGAAVWLTLRWGFRRDRLRLGMYAALRGWTLQDRDVGLELRFAAFPLSSGFGGRAINVLRGPHRFYDCATFTYVVNRPLPQVYRIVMVETGTTVPAFQLLPEDAVAAITKATGGQDLKIGHEGFDSTWRIVAENEGFVRRVLGPGLVHSFGRRSVLGMPIVVEAGAVFTWEAGIRGIRHLSRRIDTLIEVVQAFPEECWTGRRPGEW
jgi:hypothetical protein